MISIVWHRGSNSFVMMAADVPHVSYSPRFHGTARVFEERASCFTTWREYVHIGSCLNVLIIDGMAMPSWIEERRDRQPSPDVCRSKLLAVVINIPKRRCFMASRISRGAMRETKL